MVIDEFGEPEALHEAEMPKPQAGPTQLLVRVVATSVNPIDFKVRRAGTWAGLTFPAILGWDVSGVVEEVGTAVKGYGVGDEVFYNADIHGQQGTYAEYHATEAGIVAHKPKGLSHVEAAGIPLAGGTAWEAVVTRAQLRPAETALIHAAAGGVGCFAVQIAKSAGAFVFGTCRKGNADLVRRLGVDYPIDYTAEDYAEVVNRETAGRGVDFVYDTVGGDTLARSIGCTAKWGRMVGIAGQTGSLEGAQARNLTVHFEFSQRSHAKMDALRILTERGQLRPVIDSVLPLSDVAQAHRKLEAGGMKGKLILEV